MKDVISTKFREVFTNLGARVAGLFRTGHNEQETTSKAERGTKTSRTLRTDEEIAIRVAIRTGLLDAKHMAMGLVRKNRSDT
jgi:hypothetical protein